MNRPRVPHWYAIKWILRYLEDTILFGLSITSHSDFTLHGYSDVDWVEDTDDRLVLIAYFMAKTSFYGAANNCS